LTNLLNYGIIIRDAVKYGVFQTLTGGLLMSKTITALFSLGFGLLVGCGEGVATTGAPNDGLSAMTMPGPTLPLGQPIAMGTKSVNLVNGVIKNTFTGDIEIISVDVRVTVGNERGGAPNALIDYTLNTCATMLGSAQNFKPGDLSGVYTTSFSVGTSPIILPSGQELPATILANANTWDNLRLTGLHTKDQQIGARTETALPAF
jgi:hypothetical protein